jgi:hypothetical protein
MITDYLMVAGIDILTNPAERAPIVENLAFEGRALDRLTEALVELRIDPDGCRELVYATAARFQDVRARYLIGDDAEDA